ncbi:MAG: ABC transporter substrate-binding protein [Chloroflexi bacterium]|nr:ABC transporter substrate-binding protein [Chloroflexota bacterium]
MNRRYVSRRRFLAALAGSAVGAVGLAACAGAPAQAPTQPAAQPTKPAAAAPTAAPTSAPAPQPTRPAAAATAPAAQPTRAPAAAAPTAQPAAGGTFSLAYVWPTKVIDPHGTDDNPTRVATFAMYEGLIGYKTGTLELEPHLAASWDATPDGMKYTFKLRQGVKFHDGAVLDSAAVKKSYDRLFKLGKHPSAAVTKYVKSIETPDAGTVIVNLNAPYVPALATLGSAFIASPKAIDTYAGSDSAQSWFGENDAGTGPYMLKSWQRDQSMTLTRFPDYWRGWSGKHVDTVVIRYIAEQATQRQLVQRGEVQFAMAIAADDLKQLKDDPKVVVQSDPSIRQYLIRFDNQRPPLDDLKFRQAIIHAFDYKAAVDQILAGNGVIPQGYVPTRYSTHDKSMAPETFDLAKAKQLLEASKYPKGATFSCTYIGNLDVQRLGSELWQANLAKIGVTLKLNPQPWATMVERGAKAETRDNSGWFSFLYSQTDETFAQWATLSTKSTMAYGNYGYKNGEIDDLLDKALVTVDGKARTELLHKVQRLAREDAATLNAWIFNDWVVTTKNLKGYVYDPGRPTIPPLYSVSIE